MNRLGRPALILATIAVLTAMYIFMELYGLIFGGTSAGRW